MFCLHLPTVLRCPGGISITPLVLFGLMDWAQIPSSNQNKIQHNKNNRARGKIEEEKEDEHFIREWKEKPPWSYINNANILCTPLHFVSFLLLSLFVSCICCILYYSFISICMFCMYVVNFFSIEIIYLKSNIVLFIFFFIYFFAVSLSYFLAFMWISANDDDKNISFKCMIFIFLIGFFFPFLYFFHFFYFTLFYWFRSFLFF